MPSSLRAAAALSLVLLAAAPAAFGQGFGKNKVQYEPLDWAVLETPHLRLHYYTEEETLARSLAAFAESVCVEYDGRFRLESRRRIPILLYSVHHLFQQTNASPGLISEGTGGLTELIKGRVLIPHTGSRARLEWVTRHELTHAYMLEKLTRVMRDHRRTQNYLPPLWFTEGLAEFCGTHWDADAEGLLRDAVLTGEARPLTRSDDITGTVLMYKEGQSFLLYLSERYGRDKVFDLMDNWYRAEDFETAFRIVLGVPLKEADESWFGEIRRRYYPTVATTTRAQDVARRLTLRGRFNLGPRVLPARSPTDTTTRFCHFTASEAGVDLMLNEPNRKGGRRERRLLRGGQSPQFESFHLFRSRPDASPSGLVALSSKRGGRDALYVVDSERRRVMRRLEFPGLVAINDPSLAPGDSAVVFSAQDFGGRSDLYRASWPGGAVRLERLTNDDFDDLEPDVSPDGRWVAFASDRASGGRSYALFRLSLESGAIEELSHPGSGDDRQPAYSPDGRWVAFRSTRGGTSDLYVRPAEPSTEARRVTRLAGPALDPDWTSGSRGLLFTAQQAITFETYRIAFDPDTLTVEHETPTAPVPMVAAAIDQDAAQRYQRQLGLDLIQNGLGYDPGLGGGGGGQIVLSDVLGNEQLFFFLANDAERFGNFWDGFEGGVTYFNQGRRLNYGFGAFRLTQIYDAQLDQVRRERRVGMVGLASYPFDKFTRLEGTVLMRHASDHRLQNGISQNVDLVSNFVTLVHDNSRWTWLGPSLGSRFFVSAGFTRDLTSGAGDFGTVLGEFRHYHSLVPGVVAATRVQGQSSLGRDAQRYFLGGGYSLRGYDRRTLSGLQTVLVQQEVRFPLLQGLTLAVPVPWVFPTVNGALFADAAWAWNHGAQDHLGSAGAAFFIGGGYFPALRWNYAWTTSDFRGFSKRPRQQFAVGFNF
ncbi:MAG TPA: BamA/TamA family outer membrane protein [Candidatus Eisenbacteria bacterium]|jgi:Tol biopolymer transport system component